MHGNHHANIHVVRVAVVLTQLMRSSYFDYYYLY
jgi:hypothetical protein